MRNDTIIIRTTSACRQFAVWQVFSAQLRAETTTREDAEAAALALDPYYMVKVTKQTGEIQPD